MSDSALYLYTFLFLVNVLAFGLYGIDKHRAHYGLWRIPENILLGVAVIGGAYGACTGMLLFRHKTLHRSFQIVPPVCLVVWLILLVALCIFSSPKV